MNFLHTLLAFLFGLGLLVVIHEWGHYLVARWCGVKVLTFSIGFGKSIYAWQRTPKDTRWQLSLIPLGGYVKMLDEREGPVPELLRPYAFNQQNVWKRIAIVSAGPLANLLLAVVLYAGVFAAGVEEVRPIFATPVAGSLMEQAGLQSGDVVRKVGVTPVQTVAELRWSLLSQAVDHQSVELEVQSLGGDITYRRLDLRTVPVDALRQDILSYLGLSMWQPELPPVVGQLVAHGAAERSGLLAGDLIQSVNGEPVASWGAFVSQVRQSPSKGLDLSVQRAQGEVLRITLVPDAINEHGQSVGRIGVMAQLPERSQDPRFIQVRYSLLSALVKAYERTWEVAAMSVDMMGRMLVGDVSWKNVSGPVTIADYAGQTAALGASHYIKFLALISISLGVMNLLPVPVLDGGHLLYYTLEVVRGRPVSERVMLVGQRIGLILLGVLMCFAFYNDITRLISG